MSISSGFSVPVLTDSHQKTSIKAPLYFAETTDENLIEKHRRELDKQELKFKKNQAAQAFQKKHPTLYKAIQVIKSILKSDDDDHGSGGGGGNGQDDMLLLLGIPSAPKPELKPAYIPVKK